MTASTRWLLGRIVPVLGIAGLMLCLDGAVVLILAYEEGGNNQGLPPPCDHERATTALVPCLDEMVRCEDQDINTCAGTIGDVFVAAWPNYYWPRGCTRTDQRTLCDGELDLCYYRCFCRWNHMTWLCEPDPMFCGEVTRRIHYRTSPCPPAGGGEQ